jgi:hypothetical protein
MTTMLSCARAPWPAAEPEQLLLRRGRRVGGVEHVAGDQQRVRPFGHHGIEQPVEEALVFVAALEIVEGLAEMPVGGVQQPHEVDLFLDQSLTIPQSGRPARPRFPGGGK